MAQTHTNNATPGVATNPLLRYAPLQSTELEVETMAAMIQPGAIFKDNLQQLPSIDQLTRIDLVDTTGAVVASIENQPGKQGSLAVYQYLAEIFDSLNAEAAAHGLLVFAEHTIDARARPGAHPNIDRLITIAGGSPSLEIRRISANS